MNIFVLHFGQSNRVFFLGGSCMSENLKTWGKCANLFLTCVSYFLLNANNNWYNFCVLPFWRKVKVMHIALIYDIMSSMNPFHWFIVNKLQNYLFRFKMRQTRLYIDAYADYVYPTSSFSYHQKSYLPKQISFIVQPIWWWTK